MTLIISDPRMQIINHQKVRKKSAKFCDNWGTSFILAAIIVARGLRLGHELIKQVKSMVIDVQYNYLLIKLCLLNIH